MLVLRSHCAVFGVTWHSHGTNRSRRKIRCYRYIPPPSQLHIKSPFNISPVFAAKHVRCLDWCLLWGCTQNNHGPRLPLTLAHNQTAQTSKICENVCALFFPWPFFPPPFAVLGCQAILVSDRNKSFRRGSVGQPLSSTKSSRIRSQRPLSPQPAGLGEIYCEERKKKVVISWHFHDETWPKLCWLGGLEAHKECGCVWPSPSQSCHHWLTHRPPPTPPPPRSFPPSAGQAGLGRVHLLPVRTTRVQSKWVVASSISSSVPGHSQLLHLLIPATTTEFHTPPHCIFFFSP